MPAAPRTDTEPKRSRTRTTCFYRADDYRIEESIGYLMRVAVSGLKRELEQTLAARGMTSEQALPLLALAQGLVTTGADLARLYDVDPGAVTRMLDRLAAKGLVERVRREDDRRLVELKLTAEGHAIAAQLPAVMSQTLNNALRGFSREELDLLKSMLRRLAANTQAASPLNANTPEAA